MLRPPHESLPPLPAHPTPDAPRASEAALDSSDGTDVRSSSPWAGSGSAPRARVSVHRALTALSNLLLQTVPPGSGESVAPDHDHGSGRAAADRAAPFSRGPHNPFTSFYLVHVALAAVALPLPRALFLAIGMFRSTSSLLFLGHHAATTRVPRRGLRRRTGFTALAPARNAGGVRDDCGLRGGFRRAPSPGPCDGASGRWRGTRLDAATTNASPVLAHTGGRGRARTGQTPLISSVAAAELSGPPGAILTTLTWLKTPGLIREVTRCRWILDRTGVRGVDPVRTVALERRHPRGPSAFPPGGDRSARHPAHDQGWSRPGRPWCRRLHP